MNLITNTSILPRKMNTSKENKKICNNRFILKKRENIYLNEFVIRRVQKYVIPFGYGDRFIPRRYKSIVESKTRILQTSNCYTENHGSNTSLDILDLRKNKTYWRLHKFRKTLIELFELDRDQLLLQFHDHLQERAPYYTRYNDVDWPCIPRSVPSAFVDSTHDLPRFGPETPINLFAWSPLGVIAAAFNHELVLWSPPSEETICFVMRNITALSFNSSGRYLATGSQLPFPSLVGPLDTTLKIWRVTYNRLRMLSGLLVVGAHTLNAIEWHPKKSFIIVGCKVGSIIVFQYSKRNLKMIYNVTLHTESILNLKFSPQFEYVASVDDDGNLIVWKWCEVRIKPCFKWHSECDKIFFDWHPWCPGVIVLGEEIGSIAVVQVSGKKILSSYQRFDEKYKINAISFNKLSAELVVSCAFVEPNGKTIHELIVLSSLNNIVDRVRNHTKSMRLLAWGPNHTYLATPGDDESLTIWNFFAVFNNSMKVRLKDIKKTKMEWNLANSTLYVPQIR